MSSALYFVSPLILALVVDAGELQKGAPSLTIPPWKIAWSAMSFNAAGVPTAI